MKFRRILTAMAMLAIVGCGDAELPMLGKPPVIASLEAESDDISTGAGIRLHAEVESKSRRLEYAWSTTHGLIAQPDSPSPYWFAPTTVPYSPFPVTVVLTVTDEFGRTVKRSRLLQVFRLGELP